MPALLPVGSNLRNRYRIHSPLAQTNYCNLYVVQDGHLTNNFWVIKELSVFGFSPGDRSKLSQLFQAEAYQASGLEHACLPKLIDFFAQGQCLYLVREFVPGSDLASLLESKRILPEPEIINIGIQLCDLLTYLQSKNFLTSLYSDLKLSNIVMRNDGRISMLDVGFTNVNNSLRGAVAPSYIPPEQFTGAFSNENKKLVYLVGAVLYHLLTNINPCGSTFNLPPMENTRPGLCTLTKAAVEKALRNDPRDRFATLHDLRNSLVRAYQQAARMSSNGVSFNTNNIPSADGPPSWLWVVGMILACLIGGAMVVLYQMFLS